MKRNWIKANPGPYFLTHTLIDWENIFVNAAFNCIIFDLFSYFRFHYKVSICAYVIMVNHFHYIIFFEDKSYSLSEFVRAFKSTLTKRIHQRLSLMINETIVPMDHIYVNNKISIKPASDLLSLFKRSGENADQQFKIWQDDENPVLLNTKKMALQRFNYLHENPVRKGWVSLPEEYGYSSARYYSLGDIFPFRVDNLFDW